MLVVRQELVLIVDTSLLTDIAQASIPQDAKSRQNIARTNNTITSSVGTRRVQNSPQRTSSLCSQGSRIATPRKGRHRPPRNPTVAELFVPEACVQVHKI